jgi:hypothetical protein
MPAYDVKMQLKAAGSQAASTNGTPVDLGFAVPNTAQLTQFDLYWTAMATGPVDVIIEESPEQTTWRQVATFRQLTVAGGDATFTGAAATGKKMSRWGCITQRYLRYRSVLGGGSINFHIDVLGIDAVGRGLSRNTF